MHPNPTILPNVRDVRQQLTKHHSKTFPKRALERVTHIAVHHSLTATGSAEAFARYHVQENDWPGIGYHLVIEQNGVIKWCNEFTLRTYHVGNSNGFSIGVCLTGDFRKDDPSDAQITSLDKLLKWLMQEFNIPIEHVWGHSEFPDYSWKECPCIDMDELRKSLSQRAVHANPISDSEKGLHQIQNGIELGELIEKIKSNGHKVFSKDSRPFNLNIVGIRSESKKAGEYDDFISVFYKYRGRWEFKVFEGTTDPGLLYIKHPLNVFGAPILKPGQYKSAYRIGNQNLNQLILMQNAPMTVVFDANRDSILDFKGGKEKTGIFGINISQAISYSPISEVNMWSSGSQLIANQNDFDDLVSLCKKAQTEWGNTFTYTLIES